MLFQYYTAPAQKVIITSGKTSKLGLGFLDSVAGPSNWDLLFLELVQDIELSLSEAFPPFFSSKCPLL